MNLADRGILRTFAERLRQRLPGSQVFAFGSRARGTAEEDSDLDVCVVLPSQDVPVREAIREVAWEVSFETGVIITTVKFTSDEFAHGPVSVSPLVQTIRREGVAA